MELKNPKLHKKVVGSSFLLILSCHHGTSLEVFRISECRLSITYDEVNSSLKQMKTLSNQ